MRFSCLKIYGWNKFGEDYSGPGGRHGKDQSRQLYLLSEASEVKPQVACFFSPPCKAKQRALSSVHPVFSEWLICDPDV